MGQIRLTMFAFACGGIESWFQALGPECWRRYRMHPASSSTSTGTSLRWLRMLAILTLTLMLAGPMTASAQGLKGSKGTDQPTEEATQESTQESCPQFDAPTA